VLRIFHTVQLCNMSRWLCICSHALLSLLCLLGLSLSACLLLRQLALGVSSFLHLLRWLLILGGSFALSYWQLLLLLLLLFSI